ncbi:MAG TPA: response regulator [bacterium]|nr:response regulator [bacterium]
MKNIAIASSDSALDQAIMFLLQDNYHIFNIQLNDQLANSLQNKSIDLLIVDLKSINPESMGLIQIIKRLQPNLPVVMLYDLKMPEKFVVDFFQMADLMLRKPFSNQQLINAVSTFLNGSQRLGNV